VVTNQEKFDTFFEDLRLAKRPAGTISDKQLHLRCLHGLLTLFFASRAKAVVCFEPNTQNHKRLTENLTLNEIRNVEVRKVGVGSHDEGG
jgi:predicted RNA methylase